MFTTNVGKTSNETSWLKISGLPKLEIHTARGAYFDGFVTSATGLDQIFLTQKYDDLQVMRAKITIQEHIPLKKFNKGTLATLQLLDSWARVKIAERISPSRVTVFFIDSGVIKNVDINHLYEMNKELRKDAPLAFPVSYSSSELSPELASEDVDHLTGARVAIQIDPQSPKHQFVCSQFTVFNADNLHNLPVVKALKRKGIRLQRSIGVGPAATVTSGYSSTTESTLLVTTTSTKTETNIAVLVVFLLGIILLIGVIVMVIAIFWRKRKSSKVAFVPRVLPPSEAEKSAKASCEGVEGYECTQTNSSRREGDPSHKTIANSDRSSAQIRQDKIKEEEEKIIPLHTDAIATVIATLGLGFHQKKKYGQRSGSKASAESQINVSQGVFNASTDSEDYDARLRARAGLSEISSIHSESTNYPICSTPTPSFYNHRQREKVHRPHRPNTDSIGIRDPNPSRSSPTYSNQNAFRTGTPMTFSNPSAFRTGTPITDISRQAAYLNYSQYSEMSEVQKILNELEHEKARSFVEDTGTTQAATQTTECTTQPSSVRRGCVPKTSELNSTASSFYSATSELNSTRRRAEVLHLN